MMVMARDREYPQLLEELRGRRVLVWTCTTCARLCSVGGNDTAVRLAGRLEEDGVDVVGTASTSASCLMPKVADRIPDPDGYDVVLALTCDIGSACASRFTHKETVNPIDTFGKGYMGMDGSPRLSDGPDADIPLEELAARRGRHSGPFI